MDRWLDDLPFYILFNRVSVVSRRCADDIERLCAMEPCLQLKRSLPQARLKPGTAGSVGQHLTHRATGAPSLTEAAREKLYIFFSIFAEHAYNKFENIT